MNAKTRRRRNAETNRTSLVKRKIFFFFMKKKKDEEEEKKEKRRRRKRKEKEREKKERKKGGGGGETKQKQIKEVIQNYTFPKMLISFSKAKMQSQANYVLEQHPRRPSCKMPLPSHNEHTKS